MVQYCIKYILDDPKYTEENRNCQTFAADFSFLCAKKHTKPYYPLNRLMYVKHIDMRFYMNQKKMMKKKWKRGKMESRNGDSRKKTHSQIIYHIIYICTLLYDKKQNVCNIRVKCSYVLMYAVCTYNILKDIIFFILL